MNRKKGALEKIWERPDPGRSTRETALEKAQIEQLQKRIQEKLGKDQAALKKALLILSQWINTEKK